MNQEKKLRIQEENLRIQAEKELENRTKIISRNLLQKGISPEEIQVITGLSLEEIKLMNL